MTKNFMANHLPEGKFEKTMSPKKVPEIGRGEIEELRERMEKLKFQLEKERDLKEKEKIVKKEIKNYLEEYQKMPTFAAPKAVRDEAKEIKKLPLTQQIGALISLVFEKGLPQAISVARALDNPAILDEFHDILVDRYYQILIEKGILKYI